MHKIKIRLQSVSSVLNIGKVSNIIHFQVTIILLLRRLVFIEDAETVLKIVFSLKENHKIRISLS